MKILDKYIIKSFLVPFFATFLIVLFVLVMQILWRDFDELAGRGLGPSIIFRFLYYTTLSTLPTALSIGILLSSIMALGNLSENYEFTAIKSSGISLFRMIKPLLILMLFLSAINFVFLNSVFPYATFEAKNMIRNIKKKQPAMALIAGSFNSDIPNFSIKFSEKYGEKNNLLKDVLIYDLRGRQYNNKVITAKYGEITTTPRSKYMTLMLREGYYVEDIKPKKAVSFKNDKMPFAKSYFEEHQINFDISELGKIDDKKNDQGQDMMSLNQLDDKVKKLKKPYQDNFLSISKRHYLKISGQKLVMDTMQNPISYKVNILDNFNEKQKGKILKNTQRSVKQTSLDFKGIYKKFKRENSLLNRYKTEYHKRIAFSFACLVLFLVGAPLGSLIKKGGFGVPMIIAIIIFVIYFFSGELAKNVAISGKISPFFGGWLSTIIMLPFGLFLMYKAINDKSAFNLGGLFSKVTTLINRFKKKEVVLKS